MILKIALLIRLVRPHQTIKNLFIFLPLFFGLHITDRHRLASTTLAFVGFTLITFAVYTLNDLFDRHEDRLHPIKCHRPLASGAITLTEAVIFISCLLAVGLASGWLISINTVLLYLLYFYINILYSYKLKHIAILDVLIVATGFGIRLFIGSEASFIPLSKWIVLMTFLLALFLALAKRREDVLLLEKTGQRTRMVAESYNLPFLNAAMMVMAAVVIVAYIQYTVSAEVANRLHSDHLYLTVFFVIVGILRYMQLAFVYDQGGSPTQLLLRDRGLQWAILGWLATLVWILYL